jgi:hypothetical protein
VVAVQQNPVSLVRSSCMRNGLIARSPRCLAVVHDSRVREGASMRGVHRGRWDRRPRRVVYRVAVGGVTLGAIGRCGVRIVASVTGGVTVGPPPFVRGVGLVGDGYRAGPASDGRCAPVRAARRRCSVGARRCWELGPSTAVRGSGLTRVAAATATHCR